MKKLIFVFVGLPFVGLLVAAGCTPVSEPAPGEEVSTCVICHTDKDLLKQTASAVEEEKSEATSGEG
ncbi:hypothetical protein ACFLUU_03625 [Chloroflexota bacterium]